MNVETTVQVLRVFVFAIGNFDGLVKFGVDGLTHPRNRERKAV